jgi:replicative DNA helicase
MSDAPSNGARPDRGVPQSREAEEAVLGSILINPEALFDVAPFLHAEDFYTVSHQQIWDVIITLHDRREPVDFLTVVEELARRGQLEQIGGSAYITSLINAVPTALHAEAYGRIVERTALRRRLIDAAGEIAKVAYEDASEVDEVIDRAESALFNVTQRRLTKELVPIKEVISEYYDRIQYLYDHRGEMIGVPTGFIDLDRLLGGLQKSDLVIVAGRPGTGKTSFLLTIALNAARKFGQRIAVFSLEMSSEQLVQRLVSAETGIDSQRLRLGDLKEEEWPLFVQATSRLADTRIFIDDTPSISALQLRTKCRRLYAEYGIDLVLVDYLQLMTGDARAENRVQEISYISRNLKALARELDVPILAAAQLSRAVEQRQDKRPILSDLRESGSIEQDSDVVMFIYRDDLYNPETERQNIAEIHVAKHRNGPTGSVDLFFRSQLTQFANLMTREVSL